MFPTNSGGDVVMSSPEPKIRPEEILVLLDDDFNANSVCIVTGAASGVGRATAIAAAANGLMTVGLDSNEEEGSLTGQMARYVGGQMVFIPVDVTRDEDLRYAVDEASKLGTIKYLANIATSSHSHPVDEFPMDVYDLMQRIMLRAPFFLSQLCIPHMKRSESGTGTIGNMTSVHAHICTTHSSVDSITKFGLRALAQSISAEGAGKIRSFTVSNGPVKTASEPNNLSGRSDRRTGSAHTKSSNLLRRKAGGNNLMAPIEVANLFMFGFSRYSRHLVGGDLLFDGGAVLTY
jgi:3-hydroxybutyrate dehydrogenase